VGFKPVFLWTDLALWLLVIALAAYLLRLRAKPNERANSFKVLRDPAGLAAGFVLLLFVAVALLDSVHFRRALPPSADAPAGQQVFYDARTQSVLELLLARQIAMREVSWSAPLATHALAKEPIDRNGETVRDHPRLVFGGAHLDDPARDWSGDVLRRVLGGAAGGLVVFAVAGLALAAWVARATGQPFGRALAEIAGDRTTLPLRTLLATILVTCLLGGAVAALMDHYHVFGTDRTGQDVLVLALKSIRTAFVIGTLSTLAMLPFALGLGVVAGYMGGWVDEAIQYLYTVLTSVPNVLLIAACVLMVQVFLDKNPELFETGVERSDLKVFLLCAILGITGWSTLCRLVRAETLKLRELEFVQAATAFGVPTARILVRHIVPNVMHLVLITSVLLFSDLILYEAVLTYVGVGVDPSTSSFGGMINLARTEMSRDPVVWWSFAAAFGFMVALVLAANLFADGVRDAFDPRAASSRAVRLRRAKAGAAA
jgi:peptide/nickel transport system permease protein